MRARHRGTLTQRARIVAAACFAALIFGGCAPSVIKVGKPPLVERLTELRPGESTAKEVVAVLGEPQGRGASRSATYGLKDAWLYESMEVDGMKVKTRMLMLFLDKDTGVYQAHMWMASGMLVGLTKE
jgi:hypothetical protein